MPEIRKPTPLWQLVMLAAVLVTAITAWGAVSSMSRKHNASIRESVEQSKRIQAAGDVAARAKRWSEMENAGITTKECHHCKSTITLRATKCPKCAGELTL